MIEALDKAGMGGDRPGEIKGRREWHRDAPELVGRRLAGEREPMAGSKELVGFIAAHAAYRPLFPCRSVAENVGWLLAFRKNPQVGYRVVEGFLFVNRGLSSCRVLEKWSPANIIFALLFHRGIQGKIERARPQHGPVASRHHLYLET